VALQPRAALVVEDRAQRLHVADEAVRRGEALVLLAVESDRPQPLVVAA
jgi:hypothetical protein